jgi:hypothetical protein
MATSLTYAAVFATDICLGFKVAGSEMKSATVRYTSRAVISGHKLATWKTGVITPRLFK